MNGSNEMEVVDHNPETGNPVREISGGVHYTVVDQELQCRWGIDSVVLRALIDRGLIEWDVVSRFQNERRLAAFDRRLPTLVYRRSLKARGRTHGDERGGADAALATGLRRTSP